MLNIDLSKCVILSSSFDACRRRMHYLFGTDEGLNFSMEFDDEQASKIMDRLQHEYSNLGREDDYSYSYKGVKDLTSESFISFLPVGSVKEVYDSQIMLPDNRVIDTTMISMPDQEVFYIGFDEEEKQWYRVIL